MINADGSFMYTPPAGFTGSDTYTYTLHDGNAVPGVTPTDMGLITFTISNLIYFIDNASMAATSDGRLTSPYKTLTDFNSGSTAAGDVIYINHTGTNYTGGIVLANGERLFGEGHTGAANLSGVLPFALAPNSKTLPNINGSRPIIENAGGDGISLASNNTIRGLDIGNTSDFGMEDNGNVGTLTISEVGMNKTGGGIKTDAGGTLSVTLGIMQVNGGVNAVYLSGMSGAFAITGNTVFSNQTGDAIYIENSSATITFPSTNITAGGANQAFELRNNTGPISFAAGSIAGGSTAEDVVIHQGNANITYNGTVSSNSGATMKITGRTGGTIDFQGTVTHNAAALGIVIGTSTAGENNSGGIIQFSGTMKNVSSSTSNAISMTNNNGATINFINGGLNVDVTNGNGVSIIGGGMVTVSGTGNTIDATGSGIAFLNSGTGGNAIIDVNANITSGTGRVVDIQNRTGSNVTLSGNLSSSGNGILVNNNSGGGIILFSGTSKNLTSGGNNAVSLTSNSGTTINFTNGGLVISTSNGTGLNATGGGTINIPTGGGNNTISTTTGTAVNIVTPTSIGASGVTLFSINVNNGASASAVNAIVLNGTSGSFLVTGDGSQTSGLYDRDGTGGTLNRTTGHSVLLTNASNVTLRKMNITNTGAGADCISSSGSGNITLSALSLQNLGRHGWEATNITGVSGFDNNGKIDTWNANSSCGITVTNNSGSFTSFTVSNSVFTTSATGADAFLFDNNAGSGSITVFNNEFTLIDQDAVQVNNDGSGTITATVQKNNFHDADATDGDGNNTVFLANAGSGILNFTIGGVGLYPGGLGNRFDNVARLICACGVAQVNAATTGQSGTRIIGTFLNNTINNSTGRRGIDVGIEANGGDHGGHDVTIEGNVISNIVSQGISGLVTSVNGGKSQNNKFKILNNTVTMVSAGGSADSGSALEFETNDGSTNGAISNNILIQGNTLTNNNNSGVGETLEITNRAVNSGTTSTMNLTIWDNTFTNSNAGGQVFEVLASGISGTQTLCLDLNGANVPANANNYTGAGVNGFKINNNYGTYNIGGMSAGAQTAASVQTFLSARNSSQTVTAGGVVGTFSGAPAGCPLP